MSRARQRKELKAKQGQNSAITPPEPRGGTIKATSQQSRFHLDAIDTNTKEIDLKGVGVSVGPKELLSDAHLRIKEGVIYGLVGRNGSGKSTLLQAIADNIIPGLPANLVISYVSQLESDHQLSQSGDKTVLEVVIDSDGARVKAERQVQVLSAVLESEDPSKVTDTTHALLVTQARDDLEEAQRIAQRRSGQRGHDARKALLSAEARVDELEKGPSPDIDYYSKAIEIQLAALEITKQSDISSLKSLAEKILSGLGFPPSLMAASYSTLSGGWKSRASLASAMFRKCHVLLLDEPSNFLDLPAVLFLQRWILDLKERGDVSVVLVSHDRELVDDVVDELMLLRRNTLQYFDGNITEYIEERLQTYKSNVKQQEALDKKKEHIEKTIASAQKAAKRTGDDKKLKLVSIRKNKLENRWGVEKSAKGHRFKLNRDMAGYFLSFREDVDMSDFASEKAVRFSFPTAERLKRPGALVHLEKASFAYETPTGPKGVLYDVNLTIHPGERIALVGANGQGKTTLVNLITSKAKPRSGNIEVHPYARIGLYTQDAITELTKQSGGETALTRFLSSVKGSGSERQVSEADARGYLGSFGLGGRTADSVPISQLSGGQRVRLALSEIMWSAPHLVVLDEVTTHLDSDTIEALIVALQEFDGALVLVSHDRHAVKAIIEGATISVDEDSDASSEELDEEIESRPPGKVYHMSRGKPVLLQGGVSEYIVKMEKTLSKTAGGKSGTLQ